jgi:hypothetical protein
MFDSEKKKAVEASLLRPALKSEIEAAITSAVQKSDPACAKFVTALIAACEVSKAPAGWALQGVKYGGAPRDKCDAALNTITAKLQTQYVILDPRPDASTGHRQSPIDAPVPAGRGN